MTSQHPNLYLKQIEIGPMRNFVYLVGSKAAREVFVVDPAWKVDVILGVLKDENLKLKGVLITHYHFDHTNGLAELLEMAVCPVYVNKHDLSHMGTAFKTIRGIEHGEKLKVGDVEVKAVHTPGHTPGSQCFQAEGYFISGDTLFIDACGRCDLPGGDAVQMYKTLTQRIMKLPDSVIVCPGHNYSDRPMDTIGRQKKTNPYLKCGTQEKFLQFQTGAFENW